LTTVSQSTSRNRILSHLSSSDFDLIQSHLEPVDLPVPRQLERRNRAIDYVYFLERGFASVVANGLGGRSIEVGLIGREGMTGLSVIFGADRSPNETFRQLDGNGYRLMAAAIRDAMVKSTTLSRLLLRYAHIFLVQVTQTALSNGRSKLDERLARWFLMAHDRAESDEIELTQKFLATMIGVRRPGVTIALSQLEKEGLVRVYGGLVTILNRKGLEEISNGAYGASEAEFRRLLD